MMDLINTAFIPGLRGYLIAVLLCIPVPLAD